MKCVYEEFRRIGVALGFEIFLEKNSAKMIGAESEMDFKQLCAKSNALVSIGGDGTLISLMRGASEFDKPIFGVNMGRLGFLTSIKIDELEDFLGELKSGEFDLRSHLMLGGEILSQNIELQNPNAESQNLNIESHNPNIESRKIRCVNEFLLTKQNICGMISIRAKINGRYFNTYRSDGLIIGTPTGSSAHNISAGGSIVYPYNRNILLTPICAHSLTQKPLVLSDEFVLEFSIIEGSARIVIDGQEVLDFPQGAVFRVNALDKSVRLAYRKNRDYFAILREKFGWGN